MHTVAEQRPSARMRLRIADGLDALPAILSDVTPAPPAYDRSFWTTLPRAMTEAILRGRRSGS